MRRIKAIARKDENCAAGAARYLMQRMAAKSSEVLMFVCRVCTDLQRRVFSSKGSLDQLAFASLYSSCQTRLCFHLVMDEWVTEL